MPDDIDPPVELAEALTAHQPPALLVERVIIVTAIGGTVRLKAHAGLDALQLLEAAAQGIAVLMGARMRRDGVGLAASGMLVGAKNIRINRLARPGETVEVTVRCVYELGPLQLHEITAHSDDDGSELLSGELKVASSAAAHPVSESSHETN